MGDKQKEYREDVLKDTTVMAASKDRCWTCQYLHVMWDFSNGPYMFWCNDCDNSRVGTDVEPVMKKCSNYSYCEHHIKKWGPLRIDVLEAYDKRSAGC